MARVADGFPAKIRGHMVARSPWRRRLLALTLSAAASFVAGEVFVRVAVGSPLPERLPLLPMRANPVRGWEMVEGVHYTYHHPASVNSLGLRSPELAARAPGEVRVLVLGDSLVYGQGVGDDETLPHRLQSLLAELDADGRPWNVVNAGHRAYDTRQELALLEELGREIDPDVVVLCWYWNDLVERDIAGTYERLRDKGVLAFDTGTVIEGWSKVGWSARELLRRSALVMYLHDLVDRSQAENMGSEDIEAGLARLPDYLTRFRELCAELGARPLFAVVPDPGAFLGPHPEPEISGRALLAAEAAGLATVPLADGLAPWLAEGHALPVIPFDGHYLPIGNLRMAEVLAPAVLELVAGTGAAGEPGTGREH